MGWGPGIPAFRLHVAKGLSPRVAVRLRATNTHAAHKAKHAAGPQAQQTAGTRTHKRATPAGLFGIRLVPPQCLPSGAARLRRRCGAIPCTRGTRPSSHSAGGVRWACALRPRTCGKRVATMTLQHMGSTLPSRRPDTVLGHSRRTRPASAKIRECVSSAGATCSFS
jgi:hypothetical protein